MKKHLFYLLALMLTLSASCSKDPAISEITAEQGGAYRLTTLSATLDDQQTRTSLQTSNNNVVYWTAKDRIRVVNTTTYESWIYELVSGAGTSVGKFEPLGAAAVCEEDLSNIVAVYPAVAAVVDRAAKTLSFAINTDWNKTDEGKQRLTECNIRSWNSDSPVAFTHNDIKVSYHINGTKENANFKFRQLGTWCVFAFDFTSDESIRKESLQSIEVTTTDGDVQISGTQRVDLTDPNRPALEAKTTLADEDTRVAWTFNSASGMSTAFTRSMMLFPGLENKQLKITAETNMHTFVFYAKMQAKLEAGTVLRFPIGFGQNFSNKVDTEQEATNYNLAYTVTEKSLYPFYYYGDANCILLTKDETSKPVDVTPHQASPYYEKKAERADKAPVPTYAKVIWYETAMGAPVINGTGQAAPITGDTFTVTLADATKYGNALIGIYESETSDTPLWSYHIWHPEDDPTQAVNPANPKAMKLYENTYSGSYTVMPMALGATKVVVAEDTDAEKIKGAGLFYQWGRKDPLGRPGAWSGQNNVPVTVIAGTLPDNLTCTTSNTFFTSVTDGAANRIELMNEMFDAGYAESKSATALTKNEIERTIDGKPVMVSADRHMINTVIANPTKFIYATNFIANWHALANACLWGNPEGYTYPAMSQTYKSVFDPCPNGYRIPPMDLWNNFLIDGMYLNPYYFNVKGGGQNGFNRGYSFYYKGIGTVSLDEKGEAIGYTDPKDALTDYYVPYGNRFHTTGAYSAVGVNGYYWSNSPTSNSATYYSNLIFHSQTVNNISNVNIPRAFSARCIKEK